MSIGAVNNNNSALSMADRLVNAQQRGDDAIDKRVTSLTEELAHVTDDKTLTTDDKTSLQQKIQADLDGLNALRTKLDGDTSLGDAKADNANIKTGFRVYKEMLPVARLTQNSDHQHHKVGKMQSKVDDFQAQIDAKAADGEDVTSLTAMLDDLKSQLSSASTNNTGLTDALAGVTPADLAGGQATIADAKSKLELNRTYFQSARDDIDSLVSALA